MRLDREARLGYTIVCKGDLLYRRESFAVPKELELSLLFDVYGPLLTQRQKEIFSLYYDQDFSLSEIAECFGITRQGVRDTIKRTQEQLREIDEKLHILERENIVQQTARRIRHKCEEMLARETVPQEIKQELQLIAADVDQLDQS